MNSLSSNSSSSFRHPLLRQQTSRHFKKLKNHFNLNLRQPPEDKKGWDKFRTVPLKDVSGSLAQKDTVQMWSKIFKFVAYVLTFLVVLGSAVISKGTLLFMTSQIKPDIAHDYCPTNYGSGKAVKVTISQTERVSWLWAIFFSFITPEFFTLFRSVRICIFRKCKVPKGGEFFLIAFFETLHVIGVATLVYVVLPFLDVSKRYNRTCDE
jgi:chitin synthase